MRIQSMVIQNEGGNVTMLAMMVLCLLTIIGISGVRTANIERQSATNENLHKLAFFAGEAARAYVATEPDLYGGDNIDPDVFHYFPNSASPYSGITDAAGTSPLNLGSGQSFTGSVEYEGDRTPPRGSGFDTSSYRAHEYLMLCEGTAPREVMAQIDAGFYRIGF